VLAHSIELVGEGGLELLAGDVGQLGLCDQGLGLGTDKLLLENDNLGRVGLLVLELCNLVGNLLLACGELAVFVDNCITQLTVTAGLDGGLNVADALDGNAVLVVAVDILVLKLADLVDQDTELVCDVGNIVVTCLTPDGELLLQRLAGVVGLQSQTYSNLHALPGNELHAAHDILLHLDELGQLLGEVGSECARRLVAERVSCSR
jgi:hypothetical protein